MAKGLTEKQRNILEYIIDFQQEQSFPPTIREIGVAFGIGSLRGVTVHLDALVRKGFIRRGRTSRSIQVIAPDPRYPEGRPGGASGFRLPLLQVSLNTTENAEDAEPSQMDVSVSGELAERATARGFVVRIGPDGFPDEAILPEDLVVVRPQDDFADGTLIAMRRQNQVALQRLSGSEKPAGVESEAVLGAVVGLMRDYLSTSA